MIIAKTTNLYSEFNNIIRATYSHNKNKWIIQKSICYYKTGWKELFLKEEKNKEGIQNKSMQ